MMPTLLLDDEDSQHKDGVRSYVKMIKKMGEMVGVRRNPSIQKNLKLASVGSQLTNFATLKTEM